MKTDYVMAPFNAADDDTDDFRGVLFDATTSSQAHVIPPEFHGRYVTLRVEGSDAVHFGFSTRSNAAIDANATATAAGTSTGVGAVIPSDGSTIQRRVPNAPRSTPMYFVREVASGGASTGVRICLVDEQRRH